MEGKECLMVNQIVIDDPLEIFVYLDSATDDNVRKVAGRSSRVDGAASGEGFQ
jgi:hypothetical protein